MVKNAYLYLCLIYSVYCYGQDTLLLGKDSDAVTMTALQNTPCYNKNCKGNSEVNLLKFIKKEINYPESAQQDSIEGTVIVGYIVELDGSTSQHKVLKSVRDDIDKEALRICKLIKYAEPAKQKNKPVRIKLVLPITFSLEPTKY